MTKANAKGDFLRENETKEGRIGNMVAFEGLGLGYEFLNRFIDELDSVKLDQVNAFIKEYLKPEKAILVFVGKKRFSRPGSERTDPRPSEISPRPPPRKAIGPRTMLLWILA